MNPVSPTESSEKPGAKPSFRKPTNDAATRKYRRHSPLGGSDSSSSGGSPKHGRSHSPVVSMENYNKMTGDHRRKDDGKKELERESSRYRFNRGDDSHRHSDRSTYGNSHEYRRRNEYSRHERHAYEEDRNYLRSSHSGRESRSGSRYEHTRHDNNSDRSRDNRRDMDRYHRDKPEILGHRTEDKERETIAPVQNRYKDRDTERSRLQDSERAASGTRQISSSRDDVRTGGRDKYTDRKSRDDRRDHRRSPDYKNDHSSHDVVLGRDGGSSQSKETHRRSNKELDEQKDDLVPKRKREASETEKPKEKYSRELKEMPSKSGVSTYRDRDGKNDRFTDKRGPEDHISSAKKHKLGHLEEDEKPSSSSKHVSEIVETISKPVNSTNQAETASDLSAAKVAAMKAAELVNKNLVGGGTYLSTDQKKKLLWGNKKNTDTEESQPANRWDLQLFADRERQEKFNKLMGVKGETVPEHKMDDKDAEKQRELLNMDLEKQYTAGLRRRDGRTVGLGL